MEVILRVKEGPKPAQHPIRIEATEADNVLVGRDAPSCKAHYRLSPEDRYVPRHHFTLELRPPNAVLIGDHKSTNRTRVRRQGETEWQVVEEAFLHDGDEIRVGQTIVVVEIPRAAVKRLVGERSVSEAAPEAFCIRCAKPLPPGYLESLPATVSAYDFMCPRCQREVNDARQKAAAVRCTCQGGCGRDLTQRANSDGRAAELGDLVFYWCEGCAEGQRRMPRKEVGDYVLLGKLGEGGMGVVYQAWHEPTGRVVALKMMLPLAGGGTTGLRRFQREMAIMQDLVHPNLVRLIEIGQVDGSPFFVSEFMTGGDLWAPVSGEGPMPPREAVGYIVQTLEGLAFMHRKGYVHRDIKPQNILLRREKDGAVAKLADFGLARSYERHGGTITKTGESAGTIVFMPLEQILNFKRCKPPVHIYALGVTLYFLLTGKFSLDFPVRLRKGLRRDPVRIVLDDWPIPIRKRDPRIPDRLARVVDRAVRKKAEERYRTAEEFKQALLEAMEALR